MDTSAELQRRPMAAQWTLDSCPTEAPPPLPPCHRHSTGAPALDSLHLGWHSLQTQGGTTFSLCAQVLLQ